MNSLVNGTWRKSTYSGGDGDNCVEVATTTELAVGVRDSKDICRLALQVSRHAWTAFTIHLSAAYAADAPAFDRRRPSTIRTPDSQNYPKQHEPPGRGLGGPPRD